MLLGGALQFSYQICFNYMYWEFSEPFKYHSLLFDNVTMSSLQ